LIYFYFVRLQPPQTINKIRSGCMFIFEYLWIIAVII